MIGSSNSGKDLTQKALLRPRRAKPRLHRENPSVTRLIVKRVDFSTDMSIGNHCDLQSLLLRLRQLPSALSPVASQRRPLFL